MCLTASKHINGNCTAILTSPSPENVRIPSSQIEQNNKQNIKLMKAKALRKHSLHEKTAASVLLKLFISGNE